MFTSHYGGVGSLESMRAASEAGTARAAVLVHLALALVAVPNGVHLARPRLLHSATTIVVDANAHVLEVEGSW